MTTTSDEIWLHEAVRLAVENVAAGGGPFGAVIVRPDEQGGSRVSVGQNRVTRDLDPTAHAEVLAIRAACRETGDFSLAGLTLYTSCEPCPLCVSAALWARLDRVVYTGDREDAALGGFDDRAFYDLFAQDRATWPTRLDEVRTAEAEAPFQAWRDAVGRVDY